MKRLFNLLAGAAAMVLLPVSAQTAYRCDQGGQTVYSDKPCPSGSDSKAVAPTQDSAEQKAAAKQAGAQMRQDNADLDKRLAAREKLAAQERAAARKTSSKTAAEKPKSGKTTKSGAKIKASAAKAKTSDGGKKNKGKSAGSAAVRPAG